MRSYFCDKCNFEFDAEIPEDENDHVFCPKCFVTLARELPETPERIIARAHRKEEARQQQVKQFFILLFLTVIGLGGGISGLICWGNSYWFTLVISLYLGTISGIWIRRNVTDRTWRAGLLSAVLFFIIVLFCAGFAYLSGKYPFPPSCRNLVTGIIPAWIIAIFER